MTPPRKKKNQDQVREDTTPYRSGPAPRTEPSAAPTPHGGGRPKLFDVPTVRLNLFLPEETVKEIRHIAVEQGISPSQLVDRWAHRAELDLAVANGLLDLQAGRTMEHDDVERRFSKWS